MSEGNLWQIFNRAGIRPFEDLTLQGCTCTQNKKYISRCKSAGWFAIRAFVVYSCYRSLFLLIIVLGAFEAPPDKSE